MNGKWGELTSKLVLFASNLADSIAGFYETKGPGKGDHATNEFMKVLRRNVHQMFAKDYSEAKVCTGTNFLLDFYFLEEKTAVEFAFSLDKPMNEYERDIFKCLLAIDAGHPNWTASPRLQTRG